MAAYRVRLGDVVPDGGAYYAVGEGAIRAPLAVAADQPSGLRSSVTGADYLIISHADFLGAIESLAQLRREQGLRVRVVDVQDIYDEFNGGLLSQEAIRDFIQYAYFNWPGPPPSYVLLVGDGTYDFFDREGTGARTFIPPYLENVDLVLGETAADNRYVTVAGSDIMPDLHLGRLPVNNASELSAMLDKIIGYERNPTPGPWRTRAVFIADNPDNAGDFAALSNLAADHMPAEFSVQKVYLGTPEYPLGLVPRAQQATLDAFNQGALLFNYVGHSSVGSWAGELLFAVTSVPQVANGSMYPIVLPMTCLEGSYHNSRFASVGESVVRLAGRGALASWSPTGLGVANGHDYMHRGFYDALFNWDVNVLGPATTAGKLNLFINSRFSDGSPRFHDLLDTYVLLGDPASRIGVAPAQLALSGQGPAAQVALGDAVTYTMAFSNSGPVSVQGIALTATLPGSLLDLAWTSSGPTLTVRAGPAFSWEVSEMAPGTAGLVTITGRLPADITAISGTLDTEMFITSRWAEFDYSDNRTGPIPLPVIPADLRLKQTTVASDLVAPGEAVTFTLLFFNSGPGAAGGISLTLPLPVALDDLRVTSTGPELALRPGTSYVWDVAPMFSGDVGRLTVSGRIPISITVEDTSWRVSARISASWADPDSTNNVGEAGLINVQIPDEYEPDNTLTAAHRIEVGVPPTQHVYNYVGDQDWLFFRATAGVRYVIHTLQLSEGGDTILSLWTPGGKLLATDDDESPTSLASAIAWTAPASGDYYTMVTSKHASPGFRYRLEVVALDRLITLPLVHRAAKP